MRLTRLFTLTALCLSLTQAAFAQAPFDPLHPVSNDATGWHFVWPNEMQPQKMRDIIKHASPGVTVAVGTERGFILGALVANETEDSDQNVLVLADFNPNVRFFNEYNAALLDLAREGDIADYLSLRNDGTFSDLTKALAERTVLPATRNLLGSEAAFQLWEKRIRASEDELGRAEKRNYVWDKFFNPPTDSWNPFRRLRAKNFTESVYLHSPELMTSLQKLAKSGRILVKALDLRSESNLQNLVTELKYHGSLSILDISNAWQRRYVSGEELTTALTVFNQMAEDHSLLQITNQANPLEVLLTIDPQSGDAMAPWNYSGYTFEYIRAFKTMRLFARSIRIPVIFNKPWNDVRDFPILNSCDFLLLK